jgi:hypothetical protein
VAFLPTAVAAVSGSVSIVSNDPSSPTSVGLSGSAIAATYLLGANPTSLSFGNVNVGNTSSLSATLTNNGNSNVTISSVTPTGTGFSASGITPGTILSPNQSATLNVVFAPLAAGSVIGSVAVASNATNSPTTIAPLSGTGASATAIVNVKNFGATGNGTTNDTAAINSAIGALTSGATLLFPCGAYLVTSQLSVNTSNVTIDGNSCATIKYGASSTGDIMLMGNNALGSAVALSATANELSTSFTTVSGLGVSAGEYIYIHQGGKDFSTDSGSGNDTVCDTSGCRGEILKVQSVSGNTITVTTALHDTYNPSVNAAVAQKLSNPQTGMTVKNITFDGQGLVNSCLITKGLVESTISGYIAKNCTVYGFLSETAFNLSLNNVTISNISRFEGAGFFMEGNLSLTNVSISSIGNTTAQISAAGNTTVNGLTLDATGETGRAFKFTAVRYGTFNGVTVKNDPTNNNGWSFEYYSSHNTINNCVVTNNGGGGTGTGNGGINSFGNFNQYNTFNNCTVSGNGNIQFFIGAFDALRLGQDSHVTINGGTFTGTNSVESVIDLEGANPTVTNATIKGPGAQGILLVANAANGCISNNTFMSGTGLGGAINSNSSSNIGSGNILNGLSSNLTAGTCGTSSVSISPTAATVASGGTQQFTATVTGSSNTAVTWTATAGSISTSGLFTAPAVSTNTSVTVTATSQALPGQTASATVTVTPSAPPNIFGYAVQGAAVGTTMSNSVLATRYQMAGQNGMVTSMSVFIASPVSASPNNQFQVAIYADNAGAPGALIASSVSQTIVPDAWNTVPISAAVTANAYYWLAYNTNGLAANANNLRYDVGGATSTWITSEPFGTWPATYGPIGGTNSSSTSMYATFQ